MATLQCFSAVHESYCFVQISISSGRAFPCIQPRFMKQLKRCNNYHSNAICRRKLG